uniref:PH domain-containing protein n=1 Tax=Neogobius melanostomus TaxID=47308 RepID=A0A8C6TW12_9GOBI
MICCTCVSSGGPGGGAGVSCSDKVGWVRQFCGRGLFREIWKNRFLFLRGERLWVSAREMFNFDRCEELKKEKSRSKKSHSRFTLVRRSHMPNTVHSLVFLALSPEEKESWVQALNAAISRTKTRNKDPVALEDGALVHPTRERVRVPPGRRLPSRGHLLAVVRHTHRSLPKSNASSSALANGTKKKVCHACLCLLRSGGGRQRAGTDVSKLRPSSRETRVKTGSLPRASERNWGRGDRTPQPGKKLSSQGRNRCASMDEVLSSRYVPCNQPPVGQLQSLIAQRMQRAQELLEEMRLPFMSDLMVLFRSGGTGSPRVQTKDSPKTKTKKSKVKTSTDSAKPREQAQSNHSPSLRDQTSQSPLLRTQTVSSPRPHTQSQSKHHKNSPASPKADQPDPSEVHSPTRTGPDLEQNPGPEQSVEPEPSEDVQELHQDLEEVLEEESEQEPDQDLHKDPDLDSSEQAQGVQEQRAEAERLLQEALCSWRQAQEVLKEVRELQSQTLRRQRRKTYRDKNAAFINKIQNDSFQDIFFHWHGNTSIKVKSLKSMSEKIDNHNMAGRQSWT